MGLKLTQEQYLQLQNNNISGFPDGSVKIINESDRDILIIDLRKMYNTNMCTKLEFLEIIKDYEKLGWKYYCVLQPYVYFHRKYSFLKRMQIFFNLN